MKIVGVISDTHGLLRPEALEALRGSELIIHAGDVGNPAVLDRLRLIAPVVAVRGNVDTAPWAEELPETEVVRVVGHSIRRTATVPAAHLGREVMGIYRCLNPRLSC